MDNHNQRVCHNMQYTSGVENIVSEILFIVPTEKGKYDIHITGRFQCHKIYY